MLSSRNRNSVISRICRKFSLAGLLFTLTKRSLITYKNPCKWAVVVVVVAALFGGALTERGLGLDTPGTSAVGPTSGPRSVSARVFVATAYCLHGITATGHPVDRGAIAVDPRVIPLGSRLHVSGYGYGQALDTGSAIRGNRLDLWMASCAEARRWGVRRVEVAWWR